MTERRRSDTTSEETECGILRWPSNMTLMKRERALGRDLGGVHCTRRDLSMYEKQRYLQKELRVLQKHGYGPTRGGVQVAYGGGAGFAASTAAQQARNLAFRLDPVHARAAQARRQDPERLFEGIRRLVRIRVLDESRMRLDYVLALKIEDFLERMLQTQVFKLSRADWRRPCEDVNSSAPYSLTSPAIAKSSTSPGSAPRSASTSTFALTADVATARLRRTEGGACSAQARGSEPTPRNTSTLDDPGAAKNKHIDLAALTSPPPALTKKEEGREEDEE
ncbi:hypothetical protein B0H13DRAFT_2665402 [Mycena leptocephala]|nr:hypothetical protein B0H13DRAFT_2665402 [Mycena leptocephala]